MISKGDVPSSNEVLGVPMMEDEGDAVDANADDIARSLFEIRLFRGRYFSALLVAVVAVGEEGDDIENPFTTTTVQPEVERESQPMALIKFILMTVLGWVH